MKGLLAIVACCLFATGAAAQDIILKRNAEEIEAIVREITDTDIRYRKFSDPEGVTYSIARSRVFSITYMNGQKELFVDDAPQPSAGEYPYPPVSRSYAVGDLFDEGGVRGIVIRAEDSGRHGLILSLENDAKEWAEYKKEMRQLSTGCTDREDGWNNMKTVRDLIANTSLVWSNFPAFSWCKDLGPGWYLPAQKELECVWNFGPANPAFSAKDHREAVQTINALLEACDAGRIRLAYGGWSSTEINADAAFYLINTNAALKAYSKGALKFASLPVRAVHKF